VFAAGAAAHAQNHVVIFVHNFKDFLAIAQHGEVEEGLEV
jgi:hypothetical protein